MQAIKQLYAFFITDLSMIQCRRNQFRVHDGNLSYRSAETDPAWFKPEQPCFTQADLGKPHIFSEADSWC
ncbi:hypothetical protein SAMN05428977_102052 [Nitrosomonas sp. Nm166]|nr:hypothetical protein SAMN05428977_102052 [Nitrosomonas sp. Nm166]